MHDPTNEFKNRLHILELHVCNLTGDSDEFLDRFAEIWYFIVATTVLTAIGIISVLTYLSI